MYAIQTTVENVTGTNMALILEQTNMGYTFKHDGAGKVPDCLKGLWNSRRVAEGAKESYEQKVRNSPDVKKPRTK